MKAKKYIKELEGANKCITELIHFMGCYLEIKCDLKVKNHTNYIKNKYLLKED